MLVIGLLLAILLSGFFAGLWVIFEKADQPGWAAIVPIYNVIVMCRVGGRSGWWTVPIVLGVFAPELAKAVTGTPQPTAAVGSVVCVLVYIWVTVGIARKFGRGALFGVGMAFLPWIFFPILAFRDPD